MKKVLVSLALIKLISPIQLAAEVESSFQLRDGELQLVFMRGENHGKYATFQSQSLEVSVETAWFGNPANLLETDEEVEGAKNFLENSALAVSLGGASCPISHYWVFLEEGKLKKSKLFGCYEVFKASFNGDRFAIIESDLTEGGDVYHWFDGKAVTTEYFEKKKEDVSGNPYDPRYWIGSSVYDYVTASYNERFLAEKTGALQHLKYASTWTLEPFVERDGWIVASSCHSGDCGFTRIIAAISIETGLPLFISGSSHGGDWRYFGQVPEILPAVIRNVISENTR